MTLYINPVRRPRHRRMMDEIMQDGEENLLAELSFPIDVFADTDSFTIKALIPGVHADDIDIQIVDESVTISGELSSDREEGKRYLLAERPSGRFHRVITLPTPLDANKVDASLENGVLTLFIPKAEQAKPRSIKIKQK